MYLYLVMNNTAEIKTDGINVYVTSKIQANSFGKIALTLLNTGLLIFYGWFVSTIEQNEAGKMFIPVILLFGAFIYLPWRYWFWNFYGKEHIIINTKTISLINDYGIIRTNPKTIPHFQLATNYEFVREINEKPYGRLHFISYNPETNLPEEVYQTTILLVKDDLDKIRDNITLVFENEQLNRQQFSAN